MISDLNLCLFTVFKDPLLFQIGPLVQKIWCFEVGGPLLFSLNFQKANPHISEIDHPINEKFRFDV